jgi:hypothetical protein
MIISALLVLTLGSPPAAAAPVPAPEIRVQEKQVKSDPLDADYQKLMDEARKAATEFAEKKKADAKTPRPEGGFWDRFKALADKGHGPSLRWLAQNAQYKYEGKQEITAKKLELYERLITKFGNEDGSDEIVTALMREKKYFGMPELDKLLVQLRSTSKNRDAQAAALEALSNVLTGTSAGEPERKRATAYKEELAKDFQGTRTVNRMNAKEFKEKNLAVGMAVPDFTAKDIEGAQFKLSDYKGKVVLLDFWGFW